MADDKSKKSFNWKAWYMIVIYVFAFLIIFPFVMNGLRSGTRFFVNYYRSIIAPPPAPSPRFRDEGRGRDRDRRGININIDGFGKRDRSKPRGEGGINWDFAESTADIANWVENNIPSGASEKEVSAISDAFYSAADAIYNGETTTPGRTISYLKKKLMLCANDSWEGFFKELTGIVSYESISSMSDIADLYETIGDALSRADVRNEPEQQGE